MNTPSTATVTPEMMDCIADLQEKGLVDGFIEMTEELIDYILYNAPEYGNEKTAMNRLYLIQELRVLGGYLKKFRIPNKGDQ